ncbi:MAG: hypothetical protein M3003_04860 [Candidatus Dormibacteraeota bacterium]|nr:hypothetical protein [Candidatus Dormibacteraeota bacterium]
MTEHGSSGYRHRGCRCAVCRAANTALVRNWRLRHRDAVNAYNRDYMRLFRKYGKKAPA